MKSRFATATTRSKSLCQSKVPRNRRSLFSNTADSTIRSSLSPSPSQFQDGRRTLLWLVTGSSSNANRGRCHLHTGLAPGQRSKRLSHVVSSYRTRANSRTLTTSTKENNKIAKQRRKMKSLKSSSNQKVTTKDRLRLSARPSATQRTKNQEGLDSMMDNMGINRMIIKSPEELVDKLSVGLDIARSAAQQTVASLRNGGTTTPSSSLPRPASGRTLKHTGIVMDANWWFWNILFAASPAAIIAFYCEFIVKPEMKLRNQELEKEEAATNARRAASTFYNQTRKEERNDHLLGKTSPMHQRREDQSSEQRQEKEEQQRIKETSNTDLSQLIPLIIRSVTSYFDKILRPHVQSLFPVAQTSPTPLPQSGGDFDKEKNATENASKYENGNENHQSKQQLRLEKQQRELIELQQRMQHLQEQINRNFHQHQASSMDENKETSGRIGYNDENIVTQSVSASLPIIESSKTGEPLVVSIERIANTALTRGKTMGKIVLDSCQSWLKRQSRDGNADPINDNECDNIPLNSNNCPTEAGETEANSSVVPKSQRE